ncbi:MAG TPA: peptide deformylase [Bacteroidota bacterium]|nr:peptide deformylase [Bacteroidota bacterium]
MAVLPIYNCFHPILSKPTKFIDEIDDKIIDLADNMLETLHKTGNGIGLAANQVGESRSLIVIDLSAAKEYKNEKPIIMVNPIIDSFSDDLVEFEEGCLSVPDFYEKILRPEAIQVVYYDLKGKEYNKNIDGLLARVMQHEIDHLNGILFYQRLSLLKRNMTKNKLNKIKNGIILPDYPYVLPDGKLVGQESN